MDAQSAHWDQVRRGVADCLVSAPATFLGQWMNNLRPVAGKLVDPLTEIFLDGKHPPSHRSQAVDVLLVYAAREPKTLVRVLMQAEGDEYSRIFDRLNSEENRQ